jgi:hypothetical protein
MLPVFSFLPNTSAILPLSAESKIRKLQEHLLKCWLIQAVFSEKCAKEEEEDSQMHFQISLF